MCVDPRGLHTRRRCLEGADSLRKEKGRFLKKRDWSPPLIGQPHRSNDVPRETCLREIRTAWGFVDWMERAAGSTVWRSESPHPPQPPSQLTTLDFSTETAALAAFFSTLRPVRITFLVKVRTPFSTTGRSALPAMEPSTWPA